jgi:hypothetical protein
VPRVGLLWRQEWDPAGQRLHGVFAAFDELGVHVEPVVYADDRVDEVRKQLLELDGVLVWVNPIERGLDRGRLDPLLQEVARAGVWVSAHPDVIMRMATKRVLYDTRTLGWGADTELYLSAGELRSGLEARLGTPRVLKQQRGMGGLGVWKVELDTAGDDPLVLVRQALRDAPVERVRLSEFAARCEPYFADGGLMVEQPFEERITDGMIRVYLTHDEVVGFAHQYPAGLRPAEAGDPPPGKRFELPDAQPFQRLRGLVEGQWVPQMMELLGLGRDELPVIWDADFFHGSTADSYVLCEINASSTFAFPEHAMPGVARAALAQIAKRSVEPEAGLEPTTL